LLMAYEGLCDKLDVSKTGGERFAINIDIAVVVASLTAIHFNGRWHFGVGLKLFTIAERKMAEVAIDKTLQVFSEVVRFRSWVGEYLVNEVVLERGNS
jgi:hypothetical protein